jgi:uncharacterized protein (DUF488 family)
VRCTGRRPDAGEPDDDDRAGVNRGCGDSSDGLTPLAGARRRIFTVGFTKCTAEQFFDSLEQAGIEHLVDIRLHNTSQLAGYTKRGDLAFFLDRVSGISYQYEPILAPTQELLDDLKSRRVAWETFAQRFGLLMADRGVEDAIDRCGFERRTALLCSEANAAHCHRSIVADYLATAWGETGIEHLRTTGGRQR